MATGSSDLHLVVILVLVLLVVPSMNRTCGGCTLRIRARRLAYHAACCICQYPLVPLSPVPIRCPFSRWR